jgi:transposase
MGRIARALKISAKAREELEQLAKGKGCSLRVSKRARLILGCVDGGSLTEVGEEFDYYPNKVIMWRERYRKEGVVGLFDRKRAGPPRQYERGEVIQKIKKLLESGPPKGRGKWTGTLLAESLNMNRHVVWQLLRREGINLARKRSWCVSTDPEFAVKAADIIGLYLNPPVNALVLCVDEKPQVQAIERQQGYVYSTDKKVVRGFQSTYKRNGTLNLFAALEVHTGMVKGKTTQQKKRVDFLAFMDSVVADYPKTKKIHVIMDNHAIHKNVDEWLAQHKNVTFHYTPTNASWLNQIEIWFSILERNALDGFSATSPQELALQIEKFIRLTNKNPKPFKWKKREVKAAQLKINIRNIIN